MYYIMYFMKVEKFLLFVMVLIFLFVWMGIVNDFCYVLNLYLILWILNMKLNFLLFCYLFDILYKYMI